ncbi:hypothetical protein G6F57_019708 [Rhizopus arrhizus]|nr:hypothetical protein G6F57_019708 [Rhizopus arrhizus]
MFIRLPARIKTGTASSGNDSTPAIMRCATTTSGTLPEIKTNNSDAPAMDTATGRPRIINSRKVPISVPMSCSWKGTADS